ncbi:MAG: ribonuclease H family protein [Anaeromicrobium sp.]|jgi:ribonuclease HI|uniref:ribonuclease H family protein n=1 Tax=Anaeromicrobium sp. TaxID=1929132 RepID=UPI0025F15EF8|nr:ribonuclease H family protein [Anaeromicrobium sp.]MCT4596104.1 ribonuclease H family protein [Anaeromicrobium sp.]
MAKKKKYYAVAEGRGVLPNIYINWDDCKGVVEAYKGAKYKSFKTIDEAIGYLASDVGLKSDDLVKKCPYLLKHKPAESIKLVKQRNKTEKIQGKDININNANNIQRANILKIYVDGSFRQGIANYAYGYVVVLNGSIVHKANGVGSDKGAVLLRNVAGEMVGAMRAVQFAIKNNYKDIEIYYDYKGLEHWAKGTWKRKNDYTKKYYEYMVEKMKQVNITFVKVKAHSGDVYNEIADKLAKAALDGVSANDKEIVIKKGEVKKKEENVRENGNRNDKLGYLSGLSSETESWARGVIENNSPNIYHSVAAIIRYAKDSRVNKEMTDKYYEKYSSKRPYLLGHKDKIEELFYYIEKRLDNKRP